MIYDAHNNFSAAQALTAAAASTNLMDLSSARDMGVGENLYLVLVVTTALTDTGSNSTVTVDIQTDDNSSFSSNTTAQTAFTIAATAAAGTTYIARLASFATPERYMRLYYTMNNGDLSAGAVTAFLAHDVQKYIVYADAITIS